MSIWGYSVAVEMSATMYQHERVWAPFSSEFDSANFHSIPYMDVKVWQLILSHQSLILVLKTCLCSVSLKRDRKSNQRHSSFGGENKRQDSRARRPQPVRWRRRTQRMLVNLELSKTRQRECDCVTIVCHLPTHAKGHRTVTVLYHHLMDRQTGPLLVKAGS